MRTTNKKIAAVAVGAVALTGTGVAYAYWTTTGQGNGSASTANATGVLTVEQTNGTTKTGAAPALTAMFPGDSAQTVSGLITNSNPETYKIDSVTVKIASIKDQAGAVLANCGVSDFKLGTAAATADGVTLTSVAGQLATGASKAFSTTIQFNNKDVAQDGCRNAVVALSFVTATS